MCAALKVIFANLQKMDTSIFRSFSEPERRIPDAAIPGVWPVRRDLRMGKGRYTW